MARIMGSWRGPIAHLHASSAEHKLPQPPSPWKSPVDTGKEADPEILETREPLVNYLKEEQEEDDFPRSQR